MRTTIACATALCLAAACSTGSDAQAAILNFNGTATALASVVADPTCAPFSNFRGTVLPGNGSGTSSLGAFTYSHSICTQGVVTPVSLQNGVFTIGFETGSISGTVVGSSTPTDIPRIFDQTFNYTITGGTGSYLGASGSFANIGTVDARTPPSRLTFNFAGLINAPAVPEPSTWALLIIGFGLIGAAMRASRVRGRLAPAYS